MVLFGATDGILPVLLKQILDGVFNERNERLLYLLPAALMGFAVIRALTDFGQQYLMAKVGHSIVRDLRNKIVSHLQTLSGEYFLEHSSANLLSRLTNDVVLVRNLLTESLVAVVRDTIRIVALVCAAVWLDPTLAAGAVLLFPIAVIPVQKFGKKTRRLSRHSQESIGTLSSIFQEIIQGQRVVKLFTAEPHEQRRFETENSHLHGMTLKTERIRALIGPINEILACLAISGVVLYGGWSVIGGHRSQGEFLAFLMAVFLLYDPFKRLGKVHGAFQLGLAGADRIMEVLDSRPTITECASPKALPSGFAVRFNAVSYRYPRGEQLAVNDLNFEIREGERLALVGLSGSGKSTVVDLMARFIDPISGSLEIGGVDLRDLRLKELRSRMAMVGQHTFLFNASVFDNIAYGKPNATRQEVIEAARAAYALDFIERLPKGFDTVVGEGALSLSGGERQRLALARALVKDAPILILDEATASLDNQSEREVQKAINNVDRSRTLLMIAHRLSTVREADRILVMKSGQIVEEGNHDSLLRKGGEYTKLYELQFRHGDAESSASGPRVLEA
jgi:subfamily B ATP-binding cassette protein MsbA